MTQPPHDSDSIDLAPVVSTPPVPPPPKDLPAEEPVIGYDRSCVKCGFNLRGLPRTGNCPQCGTPIRTHEDLTRLEYGHIPWLRMAAFGALLLELGVVGTLALAAAFVRLPAGSQVFALFTGGMMVVGAWLLAAREPRESVTARWKMVRTYVRPSLVVLLVLVAAAAGAWLVNWDRGLMWFAAAAAVMVPVMTTLVGFYIYSLAQRVPNDSLAAHAYNMTWGFLLVALLAAIAGAQAVRLGHVSWMAWPAGILAGVLGVWLLFVLTGITHDLFASIGTAQRRTQREFAGKK